MELQQLQKKLDKIDMSININGNGQCAFMELRYNKWSGKV